MPFSNFSCKTNVASLTKNNKTLLKMTKTSENTRRNVYHETKITNALVRISPG